MRKRNADTRNYGEKYVMPNTTIFMKQEISGVNQHWGAEEGGAVNIEGCTYDPYHLLTRTGKTNVHGSNYRINAIKP